MTLEQDMELSWQVQMEGTIQNPKLLKFKDNHDIIMASNELGLIAYSYPTFAREYCYIRSLYIIPEQRNKGNATRIIKQLMIYFNTMFGVHTFEVEAANNSIPFWTKLGFELIENETNNRMRYDTRTRE